MPTDDDRKRLDLISQEIEEKTKGLDQRNREKRVKVRKILLRDSEFLKAISGLVPEPEQRTKSHRRRAPIRGRQGFRLTATHFCWVCQKFVNNHIR